MAKIEFPIVEFDKDKFQVDIDLTFYDKDVVVATIYKFSHLFYIHQQIDTNNPNITNLVFESKEGNAVAPNVPKQFCNDLIDQQLRYNVNKQFGHIRDMIVEEAFKPITK